MKEEKKHYGCFMKELSNSKKEIPSVREFLGELDLS